MTKNSINNSASDLQVSAINLSGSTISTTTSNTDLTLSPSGTGDVVVTASSIVPTTDRNDNLGSATNSWNNIYTNGISFDDGINTLSTYTGQSSYTPSISFGGGTTGITYLNQTGQFIRLNDIIIYNFIFLLVTKGSSTGQARISLPTSITSSAVNPTCNLILQLSTGITYNYTVLDLGSITSGSADIIGIRDNSTPINLTDANFVDGTYISGNGFYWV
jgi:hypothetical protein